MANFDFIKLPEYCITLQLFEKIGTIPEYLESPDIGCSGTLYLCVLCVGCRL